MSSFFTARLAFNVGDLFGGIDEDEVALLAMVVAVGLEDRIEGFANGDVIQIGRHRARALSLLAMMFFCDCSESMRLLSEAGVVDVDFDGARVAGVDLQAVTLWPLAG